MLKGKSMVENITPKFLDMIKQPDSMCKKLNYLMVMTSQADMRSQYIFPTGFGIVSSSLKASGRTVFTLNLTYKENPRELLEKTIIDNNIDVVATGGLSGQYAQIREVIDIAKSVRPDIITIVGGGIITAEPKVAMAALENADYGVIGEGEITINALAYALETGTDVTEVEGVISKDPSGGYITAPHRGEIADLDCLPFPDYEGFDYIESFDRQYSANLELSTLGVAITTSRSCPYNCTFCFHSSGKKYRRRSLDNVFEELDSLKSKFPLSRVLLSDELFGYDLAYISEFCKRIKPYGLDYRITARLDSVNDEMLDLLKGSGCKEINFGVEHISDKILESMQKRITASIIEPVFTKCFEKGIKAYGNIIFGDLEETAETVREALDWWRQHISYRMNLLYIITFPGSHIYKVACERGIIKDPVQFLRDGCPMVNITQMSDSEWSAMKDEINEARILAGSGADTAQISKILDSLAHSDYKVCIWPVSHVSIRFFKNMSEALYKSAYFANRDPYAQVLRAFDMEHDLKIYKPDIILEKGLEVVICPNIKLIDEIRAICKNDYPCVKHVISVPELEKWWHQDYISRNPYLMLIIAAKKYENVLIKIS